MSSLLKKKIPNNDNYQVIVIGGGPAGCAAAISCARCGTKTLLIEATGVLGGMGTTGLVPCFAPYIADKDIVYRSIALEVLTNMMAEIPRYGRTYQRLHEYIWIDPEILKKTYDDLVSESGAEVLFHSRICSVQTDNNGNVLYVVIAANNGLTAYHADVFIDATGDGLTAVWAGAEYEKGSSEGDLMPATLCFTIGNVHEHAYLHDPAIGALHGSMHPCNPNSFIHKIVAEGKHPLIEDTFLGDNQVGPNTVGFSAGHMWNVDSTDPASLSAAMLRGRKIAWEFYNVTRENFPTAFASSHMMATANIVGYREGNRVIGDYILRAEDYIMRASFSDEIGRTGFEMDVHAPKDPERARKLAEQIGKYAKPDGGSMGIPYRCLTPRKLNNVLVAGRSISCERVVLGSIRIMPVCLVTGEAAGVGAALAVKMSNPNVHEISTVELRHILRERGAYIK